MKIDRTITILLSAFLVLICFVNTSAQEFKWKTIQPESEEFTVEMPALPTKVGRIISTEEGSKLDPIVYDVVANNVRFQIMSFNKVLRGPVPMLQSFNLFVEGFQRAFVKGSDHRKNSLMLEKNPASVDQAAQQFQLKIDNYQGVLRLYEAKYHFYVVMVIGGLDDDPFVGGFLNSFRLEGKIHTYQGPDKSIGEASYPTIPPEPWSGQSSSSTAPISLGILNNKAIHLPAAKYPDEARQTKASGRVRVKVVVDEEGKVISAEAIEGPAVLMEAATKAAWKARFSRTRLMGHPVKVTGVLVYGFVFGS